MFRRSLRSSEHASGDIPRELQASLLLCATILDGRKSPQNPGARVRQADAHCALTREVCNILELCDLSIRHISEAYFTSIHCWLPIVSRASFYQRLVTLWTAPDGEFALLFLCMYLVTRMPASDPGWSARSSLYFTTKRLFLTLQASLPPSLYSIQAGILLAVYEHGHSLEAAYVTIGCCARIAQLLDYECLAHMNYVEMELAPQEVRTWWGLVIVDR